ncbi:MAG: hypothetical protein ACR2PR_02870 [Pseudohongiellaceae bacterium]
MDIKTESGGTITVNENNANFWGYRVDNQNTKYFHDQLKNGTLRQGWGWLEEQKLPNPTIDRGARRNLPMFKKVKKGDVLLVPRLPSYGEVTIVVAIQDWDEGYKFDIDKEMGDYGHKFPAAEVKPFHRHNKHVHGDIRSSLRSPSRFWNMSRYKDAIIELLKIERSALSTPSNNQAKFIDAVNEAFITVEDEFKANLIERTDKNLQGSEWEFALVAGLKNAFPSYEVTREGGREESKHGTDILVKMPNPLKIGSWFAIAIQVKDYDGTVNPKRLKQLANAKEYWESNGKENLTIIKRIFIITRSDKKDNSHLDPEVIQKKIKEETGTVPEQLYDEILLGEDFSELLFHLAINTIQAKDS